MDPVTQGLFGASAALLSKKKESSKAQTFYLYGAGFLAGLLADLDVLIRSKADPLLTIEYHRAFTHALSFIPVGAAVSFLILSLVFPRFKNYALTRSQLFWACLLGYASHAPLDALTNYGTSLFLPFSTQRVSLNLMAVVDPFFTLPLIILSIWGLYTNHRNFRNSLYLWMILIFGFNFTNRQIAIHEIEKIAAMRGHEMSKLLVKPTLLNGYLWRSVYKFNDRYYVDAFFATPFKIRHYEGSSLPAFKVEVDLPQLPSESVAAMDIKRFAHFSDNYLAFKDNEIIDVRFSGLPQDVTPLWSIEVENANSHILYKLNRPLDSDTRGQFYRMMLGLDLDAR